MKKFGKWIGAGLGWTIGGPIGGIIGFAFGSFYDSSDVDLFRNKSPETTTGDFIVSLLVLIAAVMKADQKILKSELAFVKNYLTKSFGDEETADMLKMLRDILKQDIPLRDVTAQIRSEMDYASRMELMHLLLGITLSDGELTQGEIIQMDQIGIDLGINAIDLQSLKSMYDRKNDWAYKVLEVDRSMDSEVIKSKYRQLALKNHPDKVAYLGEEIRLKAQEKFQTIQEAWEAVKKDRGL